MYRICGDRKRTTITINENLNSNRTYKNFWHVFSWNRKITDHGYIDLTTDDYEILYDLIQARIGREGVNMEEIKDKEIEDFFKFLKVANDTCKEKGKIYEFECPLCKGKAEAIKNNYNGHLWAKCKHCDMSVIE